MANNFVVNASIKFNVTATSLTPVISALKQQLANQKLNLPINLKIDANSIADLQNSNKQLKAINSSLGSMARAADKASTSIKTLNKEISNVAGTVALLQAGFKTFADSSTQIGKATKAVQKTTAATKEATREAHTLYTSIGIAARRFTTFAIAASTIAGLAFQIRDAVKAALEFDRELVRLKQVGGDSAQTIKGIAEEITRLSVNYGTSSSELAKTAVTLRQAGLSATETKKALSSLAKTTLSPTFDNLANTTEGAIAIMAQFKTTAGQLEKQLGSLSRVSADYAVESSDLVEAVKRTGSVFEAAGGSLDELFATFTTVRATTRLSAESISTGLRTILARLQDPTIGKKLKEYGVDLRDFQGQFVGPTKAIEILHDKLENLAHTDIRFTSILKELGGLRQAGVVFPLIVQQPLSKKALESAKAGINDLEKDTKLAQEAMLRSLEKLKEGFLELFRIIASDNGTRAFFNLLVTSVTALNSALKSLKPLIPILGAALGIKLIKSLPSGFSSAAKGFKTSTGYYSEGGHVPNSPAGGLSMGTDTVPAMLTPGEFVIPKKAAQRIGYGNLQKAIRPQGYAQGGYVRGYQEGGTLEPTQQNLQIIVNDLTKVWNGDKNKDLRSSSSQSSESNIRKVLLENPEAAIALDDVLHGRDTRAYITRKAQKQGYPTEKITQASIDNLQNSFTGITPKITVDNSRGSSFLSTRGIVLGNYSGTNLDSLMELRHELEHVKQYKPDIDKDINSNSLDIRSASLEIPAGLGDIVNTAEVFKQYKGKPLDANFTLEKQTATPFKDSQGGTGETYSYETALSQNVDWMATQAKRHGYFDPGDKSKSMTTLLATPSGQQYLRMLMRATGKSGGGLIRGYASGGSIIGPTSDYVSGAENTSLYPASNPSDDPIAGRYYYGGPRERHLNKRLGREYVQYLKSPGLLEQNPRYQRLVSKYGVESGKYLFMEQVHQNHLRGKKAFRTNDAVNFFKQSLRNNIVRGKLTTAGINPDEVHPSHVNQVLSRVKSGSLSNLFNSGRGSGTAGFAGGFLGGDTTSTLTGVGTLDTVLKPKVGFLRSILNRFLRRQDGGDIPLEYEKRINGAIPLGASISAFRTPTGVPDTFGSAGGAYGLAKKRIVGHTPFIQPGTLPPTQGRNAKGQFTSREYKLATPAKRLSSNEIEDIFGHGFIEKPQPRYPKFDIANPQKAITDNPNQYEFAKEEYPLVKAKRIPVPPIQPHSILPHGLGIGDYDLAQTRVLPPPNQPSHYQELPYPLQTSLSSTDIPVGDIPVRHYPQVFAPNGAGYPGYELETQLGSRQSAYGGTKSLVRGVRTRGGINPPRVFPNRANGIPDIYDFAPTQTAIPGAGTSLARDHFNGVGENFFGPATARAPDLLDKAGNKLKSAFSSLKNFFTKIPLELKEVVDSAGNVTKQLQPGKSLLGKFKGLAGYGKAIGLGALVAAPSIVDYINKGKPSKVGSGLAGATQGATGFAISASLLGLNPLAVGFAAVTGAIFGVKGALDDFEESLEKANFERFTKNLESASEKINPRTGNFSNVQDEKAFYQALKDASYKEKLPEFDRDLDNFIFSERSQDYATYGRKAPEENFATYFTDILNKIKYGANDVKRFFLGGNEADEYQAERREKEKEERDVNSLPVSILTKKIQTTRENLKNLPTADINAAIKKDIDELAAKGPSGFQAAEALKKTFPLQDKFNKALAESDRAFSITISQLEKFSETLASAGEQYETTTQYNELGSNALQGHLTAAPNNVHLGNLTSPLAEKFGLTTSDLEKLGIATPGGIHEFGKRGGQFDQSREALLEIVERVAKQNNLDETNTPAAAVQEAFEKTGLGGNYKDAILKHIGGHTPDDFKSKVEGGQGAAVVDQYLAGVKPVKEFNEQGNKELRQQFARRQQQDIATRNRLFELDVQKGAGASQRKQGEYNPIAARLAVTGEIGTVTERVGTRNRIVGSEGVHIPVGFSGPRRLALNALAGGSAQPDNGNIRSLLTLKSKGIKFPPLSNIEAIPGGNFRDRPSGFVGPAERQERTTRKFFRQSGIFATRELSPEEALENEDFANKKEAFRLSQNAILGKDFKTNVSSDYLEKEITSEQKKLGQQKKDLNTATEKGDIKEIDRLSRSITTTDDNLRRLSTALNALATSTINVDHAQNSLSIEIQKAKGDYESRKSDAEVLAFGSQEERQQLFQKEAVTRHVLGNFTEGQFGALPDDVRKIVFDRLREAPDRVRNINGRELSAGKVIQDITAPFIAPTEQKVNRVGVLGQGLKVTQDLQKKIQAAAQSVQRRDAAEKALLDTGAFQKFILDLNKGVADQMAATQRFLDQSADLTNALNNFNGELTIKRDGKIEVILNGLTLLKNIGNVELEVAILEDTIDQMQVEINKLKKAPIR